MKRFAAMLALLLCLVASAAGGSALAQEEPPPTDPPVDPPADGRPNFVVIVTDDMAKSDLRWMYNTQRLLVQKGTTFDNAFTPFALCCPSRASILRGQYAHNHGVLSNSVPGGAEPRFRELGRDQSTVATWLDEAGYRTGYSGKYLNNYVGDYVPPGWDDWHALSGAFNVDLRMNDNGAVNGYDRPVDELVAEKALAFLDGGDGSPFFLQIGPHAPHGPASYPDRHASAFPNATPPRYPSFDEADVSDKPRWVRKKGRLTTGDKNTLRKDFRDRLRSLLVVDEMVREITTRLEEQGELGDTYFVFTSDNGWHYGEHRRFGKWTPYEESIRVPFVVRGPGVPEGVRRSEMVLNNDIAPTVAGLAEAQKPDFVDGRSLGPLLRGERPAWRTAVLIESWYDPKWPNYPPTLKGVRTPNFAYFRYTSGERELYDLRRDPYQLSSRHATASRALVDALNRRVSSLAACKGSGCRTAEGG